MEFRRVLFRSATSSAPALYRRAKAFINVSIQYSGARVFTVPIVMPQRLSVPGTGWKSVSSTPNGVMAITAVGRTARVFRAMQWLVDEICVALLRFPRSNLRCNGDLPGKSYTSLPHTDNNKGEYPPKRANKP